MCAGTIFLNVGQDNFEIQNTKLCKTNNTSSWMKKGVICWLFHDDLRAREQEREENVTTNSAPKIIQWMIETAFFTIGRNRSDKKIWTLAKYQSQILKNSQMSLKRHGTRLPPKYQYGGVGHCPKISTTPLQQWVFWQCLPFSFR